MLCWGTNKGKENNEPRVGPQEKKMLQRPNLPLFIIEEGNQRLKKVKMLKMWGRAD